MYLCNTFLYFANYVRKENSWKKLTK
jgi:hypothetical protein